MGEVALAEHLMQERSQAARVLLREPLLDVAADPDGFRLVVRHRGWLADWFEKACGWGLVVDVAAGFARLAKRSAQPDATRPLRRSRGAAQPFDRRRYQVLCLVCAELVNHPVTTIGLLASAIASAAQLDTSRHADRAAVVDALQILIRWGALSTTAGDIDAFLDSERGNAILTADTARLHRLLVSVHAPSSLSAELTVDQATAALRAEPRYGDPASEEGIEDEDQRLRWVRHALARRVLDDPVVHLDELSTAEREYLFNPAGRRWLRDRVAEAGFELEERAEGLLAVDGDAIATDRVFPAAQGNAGQLALLLVDRLVRTNEDGERRVTTLSIHELREAVDDVLQRFPRWARTHREGDGPELLLEQALEILAAFGLLVRSFDGTVAARPALARYRAAEPSTGKQQDSPEKTR